MKKSFIYIGIVFLIILIALFVYLLFFGTPKNVSEVFTNFGIGGEPAIEVPVTIPETPIETPTTGSITLTGGPLYKLTNRSVAGMGFVGTSTLRYAEKGTGYVYEIDLMQLREEQISYTTFERVISALFSLDGSEVVYEIENDTRLDTLVGFITKDDVGGGSVDGVLLPEGAHSAGFAQDGVSVRYIVPTSKGSSVYEYNPVTAEDVRVATLQQQMLRGAWPSHVYATPAASLLGYIYNIESGSPQYVQEGGFGLTAFSYDSGVIVTTATDEGLEAYMYGEGRVTPFAFPTFPEKCTDTHIATTTLICAGPQEFPEDMEYPDDWYKGIVTFEDMLWVVPKDAGARPLFDPTEEDRPIDVARITANLDGTLILLTDKTDDTLWLFVPQSY